MIVDIRNIDSSMYFLTGVPDVDIETGAEQVQVRVTISGGNASDTPIDQSYFTSNNVFHLHDVGDLCKTFLEANSLVFCTCTIEATAIYEGGSGGGGDFVEVPGWEEDLTNTATFKVFYEAFATGRSVNSINSYFLTTTDKKILYRDSDIDEYLGLVNLRVQGENSIKTVRTIAVCRLGDGTTASVTATDTIDYGSDEIFVGSIRLSYASVLAALQAVNENVAEVLAFRLELDNRVMSYIVSEDSSLEVQFFSFLNEFNCKETLALAGVIKEVHDISQNVTVSGHTRLKYDQTVEQSFQFQSAALPSFCEDSVFSLLIARDIETWYGVSAKAILITDSTWEKSNEIGTVNSVKLTYKFTDDRVQKYSATVIRIFNQVYDNTYG